MVIIRIKLKHKLFNADEIPVCFRGDDCYHQLVKWLMNEKNYDRINGIINIYE